MEFSVWPETGGGHECLLPVFFCACGVAAGVGCLDNTRGNVDAGCMTVSTDKRTGRFDSAEQEAFLNLWRTYDCLKGLEEAVFGEYQLSGQQYNALRLLRAVFPGSMPTLALGRRLISRSPDTTRMLDRLEDRHLVIRVRRSENRRVVETAITEAGIRLLDEMGDRVVQMHRAQLGHLSPEDLVQLVDLLKRIRQPHEAADGHWLND